MPDDEKFEENFRPELPSGILFEKLNGTATGEGGVVAYPFAINAK